MHKNVQKPNVIERLSLLKTLLTKMQLSNSCLFWYLWKEMDLIKNINTLNAACIQITHKNQVVLMIPLMLRHLSKVRGCKILLLFQNFSCMINFFHCWQTIKAILGNQGIVNVCKLSPAILRRTDDILWQSIHPRNSVFFYNFWDWKNKTKITYTNNILVINF